MNTAAFARKQLETQKKQTQFIVIAHVGVYVAAMVLVVFRLYVPAAVIAGADLLVYLFLVRKQITGYSEAVSRANVLCGLCGPLDAAEYTGRTGMSEEKFRDLKLLPFMTGENSVLIRAAFSGQGFGLELGGCEFTLHYAIQGTKNVQYRFLSGTLLTAAPQSGAWEGDWLLLRHGLLEETAQLGFLEGHGFTPADCSEDRLNDRFQLYAGDGAQSMSMPRWLARRLSRAVENSERIAAIRLTKTRAAVYLENRFYTGRTKISALPDEAWLTHCPLPERDGVWGLFRSLSEAEP